jgi:HSP20 family protein
VQLEGTLIRQERPWGNWSRKLELPTEVDPANIAARFDNGVLSVRVPKAAKAKPVRIPIGAADKLIEG